MLLVAEPRQGGEIARQAMQRFTCRCQTIVTTGSAFGFTDEDLDNGGSNRFLDAMVAWGNGDSRQPAHPGSFRRRCQSLSVHSTSTSGRSAHSGLQRLDVHSLHNSAGKSSARSYPLARTRSACGDLNDLAETSEVGDWKTLDFRAALSIRGLAGMADLLMDDALTLDHVARLAAA